MTAAQLKSRERFKKAIAEAKKLRKKNPKLSQAQAVKQAWAILYSSGKVSGVKKKAAKKAAVKKSNYHKDTKSHNVNIRVMSGIKNKNTGFISGFIIKKYTLSELKKLNPIYFEKGKDKIHGVYKRKLMISNKLNSQIMIEAIKDIYTKNRIYSVRKITREGEIENPIKFENLLQASNYIGKNIIL